MSKRTTARLPEEHVPTAETAGKQFQKDKYGNFRINVGGFASEWKKYHEIATVSAGEDTYFGVTDYWKEFHPNSVFKYSIHKETQEE